MVSTRQSSNMGGTSVGGSSVCEAVGEVALPRRQTSQVQAGPFSAIQVVDSPPVVTAAMGVPRQLNLLDMPVEILEKICSYVNYNTVASLRPVSLYSTYIFN